MTKNLSFLILILSFFLSAQTYRTQVPWESGLSAGKDLQIYLVEFSPGDNITDYFGHIAMVVKDTTHDVARVYNFGLFSFDEGFITRFAMGRLIFSKAALSLSGTIRYYISSKRTIIFHELNLPDEKKVELARQLAREVLPENSHYLYHHYKDNCATRLRDLINVAVNGQFKTFTDKPARLTLREHTIRYTEHDPLMEWLLMFLMNNSIDQPIKEWDEMFLPAELIRYAKAFSYEDSLGNTRELVKASSTYYDSGRQPVPQTADNLPFWTICSGLLIALLTIILALYYPKNEALRQKLFFIFVALFSFVFAVLGTILFFMALFTDHVVTYHNENLLLASPLTFFVFILSFILIFKPSQKVFEKTKWLCFALAALSVLLVLLKVLPVFDQDNWMIISVLLPVNLACAFSFYKKDFFKS